MPTRLGLKTLVTDNLSTGTSITALEHRTVENAIIDSCKPYNIGWFQLDIGGSGTGTLTVGGDAISATFTSGGSGSVYTYVLVTMTNTMPSNNYYVKLSFESLDYTSEADRSVYSPVWTKHSTLATTKIYVGMREVSGSQNLRVWFEVISLD